MAKHTTEELLYTAAIYNLASAKKAEAQHDRSELWIANDNKDSLKYVDQAVNEFDRLCEYIKKRHGIS